jgi:threonine dehydratase
MTLRQIQEARRRLRPYLEKTPLVFSEGLSKRVGKSVFLKLETQLPTSSFKPRPAFNGILVRLREARARGVICSSSGNFAQAVAYAAKRLGVSAEVVMTRSASAYKRERTRALGAKILISPDGYDERLALLRRRQEETGRILLHQYDSEETIAGDGTIGLEIDEDLRGRGPYAVICPTSGGGLTSGLALAAAASGRRNAVHGVLPQSHRWRSARLGLKPAPAAVKTTIADALIPAKQGARTTPIVERLAESLSTASNAEIRAALRFLALEQRLILEPAAAAPVAALLSGKLRVRQGAIVCVLTGANVDFPDFAAYLSA